MRPIREIPDQFRAVDEELGAPAPLVEQFLDRLEGRQPLVGYRALLIQHQLSNHVVLADALIRLGLEPRDLCWLDVPYTSTPSVRDFVRERLGVPADSFRVCDDYRVLDPYAAYQYRRSVDTVLDLAQAGDQPLLVLDDGAYVLKALSALRRERWPMPMAIVEQTTRGTIAIEESAAMHVIARTLPVVDVARSVPKKTLEPPFIAMAVCASLERTFGALLDDRPPRNALVLGYGAIGEQVCTYVSAHFGLGERHVCVHDSNAERLALAVNRGYREWDRRNHAGRFDLVIGCSGRASFVLGDREYLNDGAVLVSASSGTVELSRKEFIELADATDRDDVTIRRNGLDERNLHSNVEIRLVDRTATFVNAGFPVNFDGSANTIPMRFIQQTPVMMLAGTLQAARCLSQRETGMLELDPAACRWIDEAFRRELGGDAHFLEPPSVRPW